MPIAKKEIPQDFLDQMKTNLKKDSADNSEINKNSYSYQEDNRTVTFDNQTAFTTTENQTVTSVNSEEKKEKYADVMNVRLSKGRRNEIKTFCTSCGISVTQYIESSFEFLANEVANGKIVISKGGIKKIEN